VRARGWLIPGVAAVAGAAALIALPGAWLADAGAVVEAWSAWLAGVRIAALAAAWWWWDALVVRIPGLAPEAVAYLNTRRTVWCAMLSAVELVVVGNVPGTLWTLL